MEFLNRIFRKPEEPVRPSPRPAILDIVQEVGQFSRQVMARCGDEIFEEDERTCALSAYGFGAIQTLCEQRNRDSKECPMLCLVHLGKFFGYSGAEGERRTKILMSAALDSASPLSPLISAGRSSVIEWQTQAEKFDANDFKVLNEALPRRAD